MSDYEVACKFKGSDVHFELLSDTKAEGKKVVLGTKEYVIHPVVPDADITNIEAIFEIAKNQNITSPEELPNIKDKTIKNFKCTQKVVIKPIEQSIIGALASKVSSFVLGVLNALIFIPKALGLVAAHVVRVIVKPKPQSPIHNQLDTYEERLKNNVYTKVSDKEQDVGGLAKWGFKEGEWAKLKQEPVRTVKPNELTEFKPSKATFTDTEIKVLTLLTTKKPNLFTEEDKTLLKQFLAHIAGNLDFNARVAELIKAQGKIKVMTPAQTVLADLREFSFKGTKLAQLEKLVPQFKKVAGVIKSKKGSKEEQLLQALQNELKPEDRIKLSEFRQADSFIKMLDSHGTPGALDWIQRLKVWTDGDASPFDKYHKQITELQDCVKTIEACYDKTHKLGSGVIVLVDMHEVASIENRAFDITQSFHWQEAVQGPILRHRFSHAAMGYRTPQDEVFNLAQVFYNYESKKTSFTKLFASHIHKFDFTKLLSPEVFQLLKKRWPEKTEQGVLDEIADRYSNIVKDFYNSKNFGKFTNDNWLRCTSVLKSHSQAKPTKPEELEKVLKPKTDEEVDHIYCSEFVGMALCYCMHLLDHELKKELKNANISPTATVIKNPVPEYENYEALHPDRLFDLIRDYTIEQTPPAFLDYIIKQ